MYKSIIPSSKEEWLKLRSNNINSTESSVLFGLSPYMSKYELWHTKKNKIINEIEETERMSWGTRLQDAIANGIAEDKKWIVVPFKEYMYGDNKIASSFDYKAIYDLDKNPAILEIKNVDSLVFKNTWMGGSDSIEAPPHIEIQVQHQMLVSGLDKAFIGVLVGGNSLHVIERERSEEIASEIQERSMLFWKSIDEDSPPPVDYGVDYKFINSVYNKSDKSKVIDVNGNDHIYDLVIKYGRLGEIIKDSEEKRSAIKAEILDNIKDAGKAVSDLFTISSNVIEEKEISYKRKQYRDFRINIKNI